MPDIAREQGAMAVERRPEGHGGGQGGVPARDQPSRKVAATYQEVAKTKPFDDRITILGIPVEQITPVTQAALAGLVAEINHLRNIVKRLERSGDKRIQQDVAILEPEAFEHALSGALAQKPAEGMSWRMILVHVATYEDIRRSSGLLAANSALADVAYRLKDIELVEPVITIAPAPPLPPTKKGKKALPPPPPPPKPSAFTVLGYAGGSNLAALTALPESFDTDAAARKIREHLSAEGYVVGGIGMALAISVAVAAVGAGESPLLALGRADHHLRSTS